MLTNISQQAIADQWQQKGEISLESGDLPLFEVGIGAAMHDGLTGYLVYQDWSASRVDVTTPQLLSGGADPTWLAIWLQTAPESVSVSAADVTFSGADRATIMANANLQARQKQSPFWRPEMDAPAGVASLIVPQIEAGSSATWEVSPTMEATREFVATAGQDQWISWAAIACAAILIVGALLF